MQRYSMCERIYKWLNRQWHYRQTGYIVAISMISISCFIHAFHHWVVNLSAGWLETANHIHAGVQHGVITRLILWYVLTQLNNLLRFSYLFMFMSFSSNLTTLCNYNNLYFLYDFKINECISLDLPSGSYYEPHKDPLLDSCLGRCR